MIDRNWLMSKLSQADDLMYRRDMATLVYNKISAKQKSWVDKEVGLKNGSIDRDIRIAKIDKDDAEREYKEYMEFMNNCVSDIDDDRAKSVFKRWFLDGMSLKELQRYEQMSERGVTKAKLRALKAVNNRVVLFFMCKD